MASMGLVSLRYLDEDNALRRQLASWYDQGFANNSAVTCIPMAPDSLPSRHLFQIRVENRDQIMEELNRNEIYPGVHYRDNTHYRMYAYGEGQCPKARRASETLLSLPMHLGITEDDVRRIAYIVNEKAAAQIRAEV
jgi:dTDP-4-amino-4,6-dideoxygalactose transaminase